MYFNLFILVPLLVVFFFLVGMLKKKRRALFAKGPCLQKIDFNHSPGRGRLRAALLLVAISFMIIALAEPQWGNEQVEIRHRGVDIIFLLDTSMSMLAEDLPPSRIIKAKMAIEALLERLKGNRVGLVAFAGSSYLECPLTIDYSAFRLFLNAIKVGFIQDPGTVLANAVARAARSLGEKGSKSKVIIVLSDGEDHAGGIDEAIRFAKKNDVRVYCIGVGRKQGEPIPLKDERGTLKGHKKDRTGAIVLTKLDEATLNNLAQKTGGLYYPSTIDERELDVIADNIQKLEKEEFGSKLLTQKEAKYHIFLVIAFIALLLEYMTGERKRRAELRSTAQTLGVLVFTLLQFAFSDDFSSEMWQGNELYRQGSYEQAIGEYQKGQIKAPDSEAIVYNTANAYYEMKDFKNAKKTYQQALTMSREDPERKSAILYNLGNTQYRLGEVDGAIDSYKRALDVNENDKDAKFNLEYLLKKKAMMDKQNQDQQKDQQDKEEKKENKDQQDQDREGQQQKKDDQEQQDNQDKQEQKQGEQDQEKQEDQSAEQDKEQEQENSNEQKQESEQGQQQQSEEEKEQDQQNAEQPEQQEPEEGTDQQGSEQESEKFGDDNEPSEVEPQQEEYQAPNDRQGSKPVPAGSISEEEAKRILTALEESEKELGDVRAASPRQPEYKQQEKDW
jgi:Ca-activated chloride channel family protein